MKSNNTSDDTANMGQEELVLKIPAEAADEEGNGPGGDGGGRQGQGDEGQVNVQIHIPVRME